MHIPQLTILFKRRAACIKGCYSQNMVRFLGRTLRYSFREMMCNYEGPFFLLHAYIHHVFFINKCEKDIACARGFIFHIEVD